MNYKGPLTSDWIRHYLSTSGRALFYYSPEFSFQISRTYGGLTLELTPRLNVKNEVVRLLLSLEPNRVKVQDVLGPTHYWCKGCGTALFRLAIQVLQCLYMDQLETTIVHGDVEQSEDEQRQARRDRFWTKWGFVIDGGEGRGLPRMEAKLSDLKLCTIEGNPYEVDLTAFNSIHNAPSDFEKSLGKAKEVFPIAQKLLKEIGLLNQPESPRHSLMKLFRQRTRKPLPEEIIDSYELMHGGLLRRMTPFLKCVVPAIDREMFNALSSKLSCSFAYARLEECETSAYIEWLDLFVRRFELSDRPDLLRQEIDPPLTGKDFMFGNLEQMSYRQILKLYDQLGPNAFLRHLNRLLRSLPKHILPVYESSSYASRLESILSELSDHISLIELYRPLFETHGMHVRMYLDEGIVDLRMAWTAWQESRGVDLFRDLSPLFRNPAIRNKTYFLSGSERICLPLNDEALAMDILDLEGNVGYDANDIKSFARVARETASGIWQSPGGMKATGDNGTEALRGSDQ